MTSHGNKSLLIHAGVGLAVFPGLHVFAWGGVHKAWWLNSGKSVELTLVTLFFATFAVLSFSGATWRGAVAMWAGAFVGMASVYMLIRSTDSPWPIIFIMGGVLTGGAILLGMVAAVGLTKLVAAVGLTKHGR